MKTLIRLLLLIAFLNQGCRIDSRAPNQFLFSDDTLLIRTKKQKGDGLFSLGVMPTQFRDTTEEFALPVVYPKQVSNIKRMQISTDFRAKENHYVEIMKGILNDRKVFIVDENNNKDFTDDSIRVYKPINWRSSDDLIKCKFLISNGQKIVNDSSWIRIGTMYNDLWCGRSEHLIASFTMNKGKYKIGIIDARLFGFFYGISPEAAILSHNTETKDTLLQNEIFKIGEFVNLNGIYYRFASITNNGEYITLIKEKNFDKNIGTQVGMIAPEFTCKTVSEDTIMSTTLHDRIIVIANSYAKGI